jgi:hypothetical protein
MVYPTLTARSALHRSDLVLLFRALQQYLLLLNGTLTAFAGLASLPVSQDSLVNTDHIPTNEQLDEAVVIARSTRGRCG